MKKFALPENNVDRRAVLEAGHISRQESMSLSSMPRYDGRGNKSKREERKRV